MNAGQSPILEQVRALFAEIIQKEGLHEVEVSVQVVPLSPEEAIGTPWRRDFPIIVGRERVIEARVLGTRGQAFTDAPRDFAGTLEDVLHLDLSLSQDRAAFIASLNAVLNHLGMVEGTVHCKNEGPERCALEIADTVYERFGSVPVGLIGLNPAIAERLVERFGAQNLRITDLDPDNVGSRRFGVRIWSGNDQTEDLIHASKVIVFTGTTLVNGTFDRIWQLIHKCKKHYLVYGMTASGVCRLIGIDRICPCGRDS